jgi:predicted nicotinamide N-methyase
VKAGAADALAADIDVCCAASVALTATGCDVLTATPSDTDLILASDIVSGDRCGDHVRGAADEPFEVAGQHNCRASA